MIDIQAGDVVVCVDVETIECDEYLHRGSNVARGRAYRVRRLAHLDCGCCVAYIEADNAGLIERFRKIKPATKKFTSQIKAVRPIREDA